MQHRILLVEDEEHLQHAIKLNLELEHYSVHAVGNGNEAIRVFREEKFDLVILDIMLPETDGLMVCENIRLHDANVPVLFLSAKNSASDRITGLKKGGDDYMTKPFDLEELLLRVGKLIEKSKKIQQNNEQKLSTVYKNQVVSREHILKVVWDYTVIPNTRTIDNFILSLRKYFETDPKEPVFIQSVRGVGYKFVVD